MSLRPLVPAILLAAGLLLPSSTLVAQRRSDQMERPEISDVRIRGVKSVDEGQLRNALATQESKCRSIIVSFLCAIRKWDAVYQREYLEEQEFRRDVLRVKIFYFQRGFRDTQVDTAVSPRDGDPVRVTFRITEGPPTLVERVEVLRPPALLSDRSMRRLVQVRAGEPFNTLRLDTTVVRLRQAMLQRGYADVRVEQKSVVDTATRTARVAIAVDPGARSVVGEVHVHGNGAVSERTIRNSLLFREGDLFRSDDLLRSQRALYESALFRRAAIFLVQPGQPERCAAFEGGLVADVDTAARVDSVKRVEVCVQEAELRELRASTGFNTVDFFQVASGFTHHNFLGGGRRLDLQATLGNILAEQLNGRAIFQNVIVNEGADRARYLAPTYQASANVRQRWFRSPRNTLGASLFANRRSAPGIFVDRGYGTSATLTREVAPRANASASYRFEITTVDAGDVYFCINFGVCDRGTINALRARQRLSPFVLSSTVDRSNDPFAPTSGYRARLELDHASAYTVSDFRYNRGYAETSVYRRVGRGGTIATRVRGGLVRALASTAGATGALGAQEGDILHPRRRFYSGGSQSVRGFGENQLGPRVLTIPAATLRGPDGVRCALDTPIRECNPNSFTSAEGEAANYKDADFEPRPLGGNLLAEGSVELRLPIFPGFLGGNLVGAAFVDAGWLRGRTLGGVSRADGAVTPGVGIRYRSPVGPIRVDVGINPFIAERLPVITEEVTNGERRLVRLTTQRRYEPGRDASGISKVLQRLTLHLSIGEAF